MSTQSVNRNVAAQSSSQNVHMYIDYSEKNVSICSSLKSSETRAGFPKETN